MPRSNVLFVEKTRNISDLNRFNEELKKVVPKVMVVLKFGSEKLRFNLSDSLTNEEEVLINNFVQDFVDEDVNQKIPKIHEISNEQGKHFHAINYKLGLSQSLIPVRTVTKGEVQKVVWYKKFDENMKPVEPVLKTEIVYNRDSSGFAISRVTTRTWFNVDGSENKDKKITKKYYFVNEADMIDEGIKRRSLLVKDLQIPVMKGMTGALIPKGYSETSALLLGRHFMDDYRISFEDFKQNSSTITDATSPDYGKKTVVVKIEKEANPDYVKFLDEAPVVPKTPFDGTITIRNYLIGQFSI